MKYLAPCVAAFIGFIVFSDIGAVLGVLIWYLLRKLSTEQLPK